MTGYRDQENELSSRLEAAEASGCCLWAKDAADRRRLARFCERGRLVRVLNGLFASSSTWDTLDPASKTRRIVRSLSDKYEDWVFSHVTAAAMYGLSVGYSYLDKIHVVATSGSRKNAMVVRHRSGRPHRMFRGVRLTTPEDTVLDCAAMMPFPDALAVADSAVSSRLTCERNLRNAAVHRRGYRGIRNGRRVVACMDGRAESGGESNVRGILIELGYLIKDIQAPVTSIDAARGPLRLDILLQADDGSLVDLEVDGGREVREPRDERWLPAACADARAATRGGDHCPRLQGGARDGCPGQGSRVVKGSPVRLRGLSPRLGTRALRTSHIYRL